MQTQRTVRNAMYLVFALVFILGGCSSDDDPTTPEANPFAGVWDITFEGTYSASESGTIGDDGSCTEEVVLSDGTGSFTNTVSFEVNSDGSISNGKIFYEGNEVGTVSGNFTGNSGSGTYATIQPSSGTWTASKQ